MDDKQYKQWLEMAYSRRFCITGYLKYFGYRRIALLSQRKSKVNAVRPIEESLILRELISDTDTTVIIISNAEQTPVGMNQIKISELNTISQYADCVVTINTEVTRRFKRQAGIPVLSLETIINKSYKTEFGESGLIKTLSRLRNRGVNVLLCIPPIATLVENKSPWEKYIMQNKIEGRSAYLAAMADIKTFELSGYGGSWSALQLTLEELKTKYKCIPKKDYYVSSYNNTDNFPNTAGRKVWIFGDSSLENTVNPIEYRIPYLLQKKLESIGIAVVNKTVFAATLDIQRKHIEDIDEDIMAGDCVVCARRNGRVSKFLQIYARLNNIPCIDFTQHFQRPPLPNREVFADAFHVNPLGAEILAKVLYDEILNIRTEPMPFRQLFAQEFQLCDNLQETYNPIASSATFANYISTLKKMHFSSGKTGAIVMNCNPFTLGHRYLIETCASKVTNLIIFVVEEDRSDFPFADRLQLIRKGTADLDNVIIIPSGQFIISTVTFPEYFEKGDRQEDRIS